LLSWNDGKAKQSVLAFVKQVTSPGSHGFVPPAERIATFDNNGTLWAEQPMYFQLFFALDRVKALAPQHPEWKQKEPFASLLKGDVKAALAGGDKAIALDAHFVPAYVNLADLYRAGRREADAERVLRDGLRVVPNAATLRAALGLALVRQGKKREALAEFAAAVKAAPDDPRHTYIYAVALHDAGRRAEAIRLLESAAQHAGDRDVLLALAAFKREAGDRPAAEAAMRTLAGINPDDPALNGFAPSRP
jgi:tetratricopeptide (TPR) repeat protein